MERITEAFVWPFRDPEWLQKVSIMGVILLIPIVGSINGLGWMLAALDRLRAGEETLPPSNFDYLRRGFGLFAVSLVYDLVFLLIAAVVYLPAVLILDAEGRSSPNAALVAVGASLSLLAFSILSLGSLVVTFATPSIVLELTRGGIWGALRVAAVVAAMRKSPANTVIAGLMLVAVQFIAGLGLFVCVIGVLFTSALALAMVAWIIRSFEVGSPAPAG
jgi:Protein of unknown function (DUF4013)